MRRRDRRRQREEGIDDRILNREPGMVVGPDLPMADRRRCARDSEWCDGRLCAERGIECPNADR